MKDGNSHTIATTQFESTNARRAFPCFDEPDFKATFGVTLVVDEDLMAVSCGELVDSQPLGDGRRRDRFADTMEMSTYLVAFIVGELEAGGDVRVAIVHRLGDVPVGEPSVAIAVASAHRQAAYEASRTALERLKREVPIWKREHYADGRVAWREEEPLVATP